MAIISSIIGANNNNGVVYTCPAGVSHAVVHVYAYQESASSLYPKLNDSAASIAGALSIVNNNNKSYSSSLILKPGDFIGWWMNGGGAGIVSTIYVTGYEVLL